MTMHDLVGAYAVDAVDPTERDEFEHHLATCPDCRSELTGLREAAAALGAAVAVTPPPGLRSAVLAAIDETRLPAADPAARQGRFGRWLPRLAVPVAAALAIAVVVLGSLLASVDRRSTADRALETLLAAPDASVVTLEGQVTAARLVFSEVLGQGVFIASGLAPVASDRTYELWLIGATGPRPAGTFRPEGGRAALLVPGDYSDVAAVGVTVEPAGGSPEPTGEVIIVGTTG